ncbi:unnamed protein product, partial [Symbiodinium sp. CCMP2592]
DALFLLVPGLVRTTGTCIFFKEPRNRMSPIGRAMFLFLAILVKVVSHQGKADVVEAMIVREQSVFSLVLDEMLLFLEKFLVSQYLPKEHLMDLLLYFQ